jgi:hypothetical protein
MSTQKAVTSQPTKNNGGSVINAGTDYETNPVLGSRFNSSRADFGVFGSTVVEGVNTSAAVSEGIFGKLHDIVAKRISISLAGTLSNEALLSGAGVPSLVRSIHKLETLRSYRQSTAFRAGNFNLFTGKYSPTPTVAVDSLSADSAATPTRAVPGTLVFKGGALVPVSKNYKAKT